MRTSAPERLTTWYWAWSLCSAVGFVTVYGLLLSFGSPVEHSGDAVARLTISIALGSLAGGTLLCVLMLLAIGARGRDSLSRVPAVWKLMGMLLPAIVVALAMVNMMRPRESVGVALFHPTAGVLGGGREEVELPLPPGWRAVYDLRQDWRSTSVRDAAGELAFVVTVDLQNRDAPDCSRRSTPRGEAWTCRTVKDVGRRPAGPWVRFEHFERWRGRMLAIGLSSPASRADELEPIARSCVDAVRLRAR